MSTEAKVGGYKFRLTPILLVTACWFIMFFVIAPHNPFAGTPMLPDDYIALSTSWANWHFPCVRPVADVAAILLASMGPKAWHVLQQGLVILYAVLSFQFIGGLLELECGFSILESVLFGMLVFSMPYMTEYNCRLSPTINLISCNLGILALMCLAKTAKRKVWLLAAIPLLLLSIFAKEDYILPLVIYALYLVFFQRRESRLKTFAIFIMFFFPVGSIFLYYNYKMLSNPFISGKTYYHVAASATALEQTLHYYFATPASILFITACIYLMLAKHGKQRMQAATGIALTAAVTLPYLLLPDHLFDWYAYNWFPMECAIIIAALHIALQRAKSKLRWFVLLPAACLIVTLLVSFSRPLRNDKTVWFGIFNRYNHNVLETLENNKNLLNGYARAGVIGIGDFSPWSNNTGDDGFDTRGRFLKNSGFHTKWILFVETNTPTYHINDGNILKPDEYVNILGMTMQKEFPDMPCLLFDKDGNGILIGSCASFPSMTKPAVVR
jgi:hypothetical protein